MSPTITMNVLVTAGPTREYVDPVRYISNASSGKMGLAIADAFAQKGAQVRLAVGPIENSNFKLKENCHCEERSDVAISVNKVETAEQMYRAVLDNFEWADIVIMAAAVADYRPVKKAKHKIKKTERTFNMQLEKTPDILGELGNRKRNGQVIVGFALETENLIENAKRKLEEKNVDLIVANSEQAIAGNSADFFVIDRDSAKEYKNISKTSFAERLANHLIRMRLPRRPTASSQ